MEVTISNIPLPIDEHYMIKKQRLSNGDSQDAPLYRKRHTRRRTGRAVRLLQIAGKTR